jgi:hypothetical protein
MVELLRGICSRRVPTIGLAVAAEILSLFHGPWPTQVYNDLGFILRHSPGLLQLVASVGLMRNLGTSLFVGVGLMDRWNRIKENEQMRTVQPYRFHCISNHIVNTERIMHPTWFCKTWIICEFTLLSTTKTMNKILFITERTRLVQSGAESANGLISWWWWC